jgi:hypothetical protein
MENMSVASELLERVKVLNAEKKYQEVIDLMPDELLKEYQNFGLWFEKGYANIRLFNELI